MAMKKFFLFFLFFSLKAVATIRFDFEQDLEGWESAGGKGLLEKSSSYAASGRNSLCVSVNQAKEGWVYVRLPEGLGQADTLILHLFLPEDAPLPVTVICYIKDKTWDWFETEPVNIRRGEERTLYLDISNESLDWQPVGHLKTWDGYVRQSAKELGLRFFFSEPTTQNIYLDAVETIPQEEERLYLYNFSCPEKVNQYQLFEVTFDLPFTFSNPFDPEVVDIQAVFTLPSGEKKTIPAFFYHDYLRFSSPSGEKLYPYGNSEWRVRFTPEKPGNYSFIITVTYQGKETKFSAGSFTALPSEKPGFVRWDKNDPYWLAFENGKFFYPVGHTLRSPDDARSPYTYEFVVEKERGTYAYDVYFPRMKEAGENFIRMWMSAWWAGLEWNPSYAAHFGGLGRYSLENAWRLDRVLEAAEANGIYILLTLINHGQFSINPDAEWWDNPYNILNGGFLSNPDEFFTDERAHHLFKKRLRYIVSRWSYSPQIVFWEMWNEVDLTGYYDSFKVRYWHQRLIPYLKSIDPYQHLVTTHICRRNVDPLVWILPEVETIVGNAYAADVVTSMREYYLTRKPYNKPIMINEFGVGRNRLALENNLHAGIWTSALSPMFGVALFWWWPFIDHFQLYFHYRALANYLQGEDWRGKNLQLATAKFQAQPGQGLVKVDVTGMQNKEAAYLWVYDTRYFNTASPKEKVEPVPPINIMIECLLPGKYQAEFWDTYHGKIISKDSFTVQQDSFLLPVPSFEKDLAIKLIRIKP